MSQTPYTTTTSLKNYLKIASTDSSNDSFLTMIIPQIASFIDSYTGRTFGWGDSGDTAFIDYSNTTALSVSSATVVGNIVTYTFTAPTPFKATQSIKVSGFTPTALNGTWVVQAVNSDLTQIQVNLGFSGVLNATIIGEVSPNVSNYAFKQQQEYDGVVGNTFYLRDMDIRQIDAMWIGSRNIYPPVLLDPNQYIWRDDGRVILGGAYFNSYNSSDYTGADSGGDFSSTTAAGYQTIMVSYHYGFVGVPGDITLAANDIVSAIHRLRLSQGVHSEQAGDYRITYDDTLRHALAECPDTLGTLSRYRKINL